MYSFQLIKILFYSLNAKIININFLQRFKKKKTFYYFRYAQLARDINDRIITLTNVPS